MKKLYFYNAKILNVVDGDTVDALIDLGFKVTITLRLRFNGIDTSELHSSDPELRERANKAKAFVTENLLNKEVVLQTYKADKYGRYLADIYLIDDTVSINTKLLNEGLAVVYK